MVHCEGHFAGLDAGMVLDGVANGIPIVTDLEEALALVGRRADTSIDGMAPATGLFRAQDRQALLSAHCRARTDGAIGKRTTATLVSTGQTGLIQGGALRHSPRCDSIPVLLRRSGGRGGAGIRERAPGSDRD